MIITTYKLLIPAIPFPFESTVSATNLKSAIGKAKHSAKMHGIKTCRGDKVIEMEIISKRTI